MSNASEQSDQRRANLEAITKLGIRPYPHKFATTDTVSALVDRHGAKAKDELESARVDTIAAGRIISIRSFGKASFFVLSDGRSRIQVYVRQDAISERDFAMSKLLDYGDH